MAKKENLPLSVDVNDLEPGSSITYASEVVAIIAGIAAAEVEGVAAMVSVPNGGNLLGKNRNVTKGVKVEVGTEEVSVDLYMNIEYGQPIQKVAQDAQENVRRAIAEFEPRLVPDSIQVRAEHSHTAADRTAIHLNISSRLAVHPMTEDIYFRMRVDMETGEITFTP